jgi:hypothetical protein
MAGHSRALLKMMMNSKIPRKAPWGDDPGRYFLEEYVPLYRMYIYL